jgi:hypothetical protein
MKGVLAYLLVGSYGTLLRQWRQRRAQGRAVAPQQTKETALVT